MKNEMIKDTRLLEALDYIDTDLIGDVAVMLKLPSMTAAEPVRTWKTPFKYWKQFTALAACMVLLSVIAPMLSNGIPKLGDLIASLGGNSAAGVGTTDEISDSESKELHELFPDYTPIPLSEKRIEELAEVIPVLADTDEWTQYVWRVQRYLGDFNGCYCFYTVAATDAEDTEIIAGYEFTYSKGFTLYAIYKGEKMYLREAFDRGYLTQDEVGMMAAYHERIRRNIVTFNPPETTTPLYILFPDYIPEPLDSSKKEAIEALMGGDTSWYHENRKNFYGIQYLGTFGECIVLSRRGEGSLKPRNIAGYDFYVSDGADVVVYFDNQIIDLEDAYNLGFISKEDIGMAACLHDRLRRGFYYKKDWNLETNN